MTNDNIDIAVPMPGEFIKEELEARGWTQGDLAYVLGISPQNLHAILAGKRGISSDMAKALGKAFDVNPAFFTNLQAAYDLSVAIDPDPSIEHRARLQDHFPVREMIKRGWIDEGLDVSLLEAQMMRFFRVTEIEAMPYLMHAAKKASPYEERNIAPVQLAWLFRVYQIAECLEVPRYSQTKLQNALDSLRLFMAAEEEIRQVPRILNECGVRLVFVEALPSAKIDGVCLWLDKHSPVIGMSLRFDRIDNFWFVLRHEIEHVLNKDGQGKGREIIDDLENVDDASMPEEERVANTAAQDFCVPRDKLVGFIARKSPYFSEQDIAGFARILGVHIGIVVGQIHSYTRNFKLLRKHLVKVRQFIAAGGITDGWGEVFPISL